MTSLHDRNGPAHPFLWIFLVSVQVSSADLEGRHRSLGLRAQLVRKVNLCPFLVSREISHLFLWPSFPKAISQLLTISPNLKWILSRRTALHIFWLQRYWLKRSTYNNFGWCEWERVACVIAATRQGATVYLSLDYWKCCPHFFLQSTSLLQASFWRVSSLTSPISHKIPQCGSWGQINFQQIPLPWTPSCVISLEMTSQHWWSPLSAFLNDLKLSDQITSILPLLDIFLVKANTKRSVVMMRVSSRCTQPVADHVNRQTEDLSASWNSFLMYKGPRKSIPTCLSCGDGVTRSSGRGVILCTRVVVLKYR